MKKLLTNVLITSFIYFLFSCGSDSDNIAPTSPTSGKGGSLARFAIVGSTMYFVDNSQMQVYDITTPQQPRLVHTLDIASNTVETIFHYGLYLYLGSSNGMFIYNISQPYNPEYMSMATHVNGCDPVVSDGKYAYVTVKNTVICNRNETANVLDIFNVENPRSPVQLSSTALAAPNGLAIDGDILFVCDDDLKVFDVSDRSNPILIKVFPSNAIDIIIDGDVILTVDPDGINQYFYDREQIELTHTSKIITS